MIDRAAESIPYHHYPLLLVTCLGSTSSIRESTGTFLAQGTIECLILDNLVCHLQTDIW